MRLNSILRLAAAAVAAVSIAASASAAKQCFFGYAEFEKAVPHFDVQACPGAPLASDKGFCRLGLDGTTVRVYRFVFVEKEACLETIEVVPFAEFTQRFGTTYENK